VQCSAAVPRYAVHAGYGFTVTARGTGSPVPRMPRKIIFTIINKEKAYLLILIEFKKKYGTRNHCVRSQVALYPLPHGLQSIGPREHVGFDASALQTVNMSSAGVIDIDAVPDTQDPSTSDHSGTNQLSIDATWQICL